MLTTPAPAEALVVPCSAGVNSPPVSYMVGGKRYIAVAAAGTTSSTSSAATASWCLPCLIETDLRQEGRAQRVILGAAFFLPVDVDSYFLAKDFESCGLSLCSSSPSALPSAALADAASARMRRGG
jgi:hypothetical protein